MLALTSVLSALLTIHSTLAATSVFMGQGTDQFVPNTLVLGIDHKSQEAELGDPAIPGETWAARVYHIKTPLTTGSLVMYRFSLIGYSYGAAQASNQIHN